MYRKKLRNKFNGPSPKNKTGKRKHNRRQRPNSNKRKKDNAKSSKNDNKCHRCGDFSHFAKNCRTPKHLVALYQKSFKSAGDTRYEAHFNLASEAVLKEGCSNQAPKEQVNNDSLNIEENLPSTDNILLDFGSGDVFGDLE